MNRSPQHSDLIERIRRTSPEGPGVYIFRGDRDEIIYVGKAVRLQQRMLSHLRIDPLADPSRHSRMVFEVRDFEVRVADSELLALLLEDELIKLHRPRFNIRQNEFLEYKYLELTADRFPRLRMLDHEADFGTRNVFGPYRDRYFIEDVLGLIHDYLGLRSCAASEPGDRCIRFDLGQCAGPCRGTISAREYEPRVTRTMAFLDGDVSEVAARLTEAMSAASERFEYEKAQAMKERLAFCGRFGERQRFIAAFRESRLTIVEAATATDPTGRTYQFHRGQLITCERDGAPAAPGDDAGDRSIHAGRPTSSDGPTRIDDDPRFLLDRAAIVHGWLRRNSTRCRWSWPDDSR